MNLDDVEESWQTQKPKPTYSSKPKSIDWEAEQRQLPTRPSTRAPTEFISEAQLRIVGEKVVLRWENLKFPHQNL